LRTSDTRWYGGDVAFCVRLMAGSSPQPSQVRQVQPDGAVLFCGTSLRVRIFVIKPGFVLATATGEVTDTADRVIEDRVLAELDAELERASSLTLFADLRGSPRMPAESREKVALWLRRHQARLMLSHVLVGSKLLEMALSIITMLVGGGVFKVYSRPQSFLDQVKKVAPKLTELPQVPAAK